LPVRRAGPPVTSGSFSCRGTAPIVITFRPDRQ
jgi:hypothetical protein